MRQLIILTMITIIFGKVISQPDCPPCNCMVDTLYGGVKAMCSKLRLSSVPKTLPWNTTSLIMDRNNINGQAQRPFAALKYLKYLNLFLFDVGGISDDIFSGLDHLEVLLLDVYDKPHGVFYARFLSPLASLRNISLHILSFNLTYECTSCPATLKYADINCVYCKFGYSFLKLKQLTMLSLSGQCVLRDIDRNTFQSLPYLEILEICNCTEYYFIPGMFDSLHNLRKLKMKVNLIFGDEFKTFKEVTKSLQFSPIEYISFSTHRTPKSYPDMFLYLQKTSLRELHISCENNPFIRRENFRKLPKTLAVLTLKHIQYDHILTEIVLHPSLKTLDLSNVVIHRRLVSDFAIFMLSPILETYICCNCPFIDCTNYCLSGPRNIKHFITPHNNVSQISPYFHRCLPKIETLDLSDNILEDFQTLPLNNSVTNLSLARNRLGNSLTGQNTTTLKSLSKLKIIDLSGNGVSLLTTNSFENLHNIRVINLSNNHIESFNVRLIKLSKLEILDLHNNKINTIGAATRKDIAGLPWASLHLQGNPLICDCEELESLLWMKENQRQIYRFRSLKCRIPTGEYKTLDNLDQIISNLQAKCKSFIVEISVSVCVTICAIALVGGVLLYRHRWKLRYLYYAGRRGYRQRFNREQVHQEQYEYDAFISYDDRDRRFVIDEMMPQLEEKHGLKLCIHQRDFLPGEVISDNIVNAIQNSKKTIVVLSPSFLESTWCEFEFNMARMEGVTRRQDVVLVLLYEDVLMGKLSKDMAMMMKQNCYLEYNHEVFNRDVFWSLVQESIQIIRPRD